VYVATLFVEEEILLNSSENGLQFKVYTLNNIAAKFSVEINTGETKIMAFRRMEPIGSRICIDDRMLKQITIFSYLGYNISYKEERDLNVKVANSVKILGIINQMIKPSLVSSHTKIRTVLR
jgi:hypothetical protein